MKERLNGDFIRHDRFVNEILYVTSIVMYSQLDNLRFLVAQDTNHSLDLAIELTARIPAEYRLQPMFPQSIAAAADRSPST